MRQDLVDEYDRRLRWSHGALDHEREAVIAQIVEAPQMFEQELAGSYSWHPDGLNKALRARLNEYRGTQVGGAYRGK